MCSIGSLAFALGIAPEPLFVGVRRAEYRNPGLVWKSERHWLIRDEGASTCKRRTYIIDNTAEILQQCSLVVRRAGGSHHVHSLSHHCSEDGHSIHVIQLPMVWRIIVGRLLLLGAALGFHAAQIGENLLLTLL